MDKISEIKSKLDIVYVVSRYVNLRKVGSRYVALCPFHNEKTPSFIVSPELQIFKCFGCGEGGDIFTFVQKIEKIDFGESLKILAKEAGVSLESKDFTQNKIKETVKDKILKVIEKSILIGQKYFWESENDSFRKYFFKKRKLNENIARIFSIGGFPNDRTFLIERLLKLGFSLKEIIGSGFCYPKNNKFGAEDRFSGRIIIPIRNDRGEFVGVSGRIVEEYTEENIIKNSGKYINSPETEVFKKSETIFGLFEAKEEIKKKGEVFLVEGQFDVLTSFKNGIKNIVCSSGTSLTEFQLRKLSRLAGKIFILFDSDEAGQKARLRVANLACSVDSDVFGLKVTKGKDLDEFLANGGDFNELKKESKNLFSLVAEEQISSVASKNTAEKEKVLKNLVDISSNFTPIRESEAIEKIVELTKKFFGVTLDKERITEKYKLTKFDTKKLDKKGKINLEENGDLDVRVLSYVLFIKSHPSIRFDLFSLIPLEKYLGGLGYLIKDFLYSDLTKKDVDSLQIERTDLEKLKLFLLEIEESSGGNENIALNNFKIILKNKVRNIIRSLNPEKDIVEINNLRKYLMI